MDDPALSLRTDAAGTAELARQSLTDALLRELAERGDGDDEAFVGQVMRRLETPAPAAPRRTLPDLVGTALSLALIGIGASVLRTVPDWSQPLAPVVVLCGLALFLVSALIGARRSAPLLGLATWHGRAVAVAVVLAGIWLMGGP